MRPWPRSRASTARSCPIFDARPQPSRATANSPATLSKTLSPAPCVDEPSFGDFSTSDNGHADAATERVRDALAQLTERQRLVLFLHYYADLGYATIAEAIGISSGTVGATLHTARANMRRRLEEPT